MPNPDLGHRHPTWERMFKRWQMAWDFRRGGVHVLQPDHSATPIRWATYRMDGEGASEDSEQARRLSNYSWTTGWANSYLWKHRTETNTEYEERSAKLFNYPVFASTIDMLVSGVFRTDPPRNGDIASWQHYLDDVDLCGTSVNAYCRQALALALTFGRAHSVTDMPIGDAPINQLQQLTMGQRSYSYLVSPLDMVDWSLDDKHRFRWVVLYEPPPDDRQPGQKIDDKQAGKVRYRVLYPGGWQLWEGQERTAFGPMNEHKYDLVAEGYTNLSIVQLSTLFATKLNQRNGMDCESPISDVLDINRDVLNDISEGQEVDSTQTFATLWFPEQDGHALGPIDIGPHRALSGSAEAGAPQYISPDASHPEGRARRREMKIRMARELASVGRGKSEYSKEERSAEALSVESRNEQNQLAIWASATEEFENHQLELNAQISGASLENLPFASYSRSFDERPLQRQLSDLKALNDIGTAPPDVLAKLTAPIIKQMLTQGGFTQDEIDEAVAAVVDYSKPEPEPEPAFEQQQGNPFNAMS